MRKIGFTALGLVMVVAIAAAVFWFTIPPTPTLARDFEPAAADSAVTNPELRAELLRMRALDQGARDSTLGPGLANLKSLGAVWRLAQSGVRMRRVDGPNTQRLKEIVEEHGWPTRGEVGTDGRKAIFLIVQHADHDAVFQREALGPMRIAYAAGDASGRDLALLIDRVLVAEGRAQLYGSQFLLEPGKGPALHPIEDEPNVDARRAEMGLSPLANYLEGVCAETGICIGR